MFPLLSVFVFYSLTQATRRVELITNPSPRSAGFNQQLPNSSCRLQPATAFETDLRDYHPEPKPPVAMTAEQARIIVSLSQSSGTVIFQNQTSRRIAVNFRTCSVRAISVGKRSIELAP